MRPAQYLLRALPLALTALVVLLASSAPARAGFAPYSDPGKIDFDTALNLLNPYGTWTKVGDKWAWTPLDHAEPYTNGRWLYTEYGWFWKGNAPTSWLTEHYGYWKRSADRVWSWYPAPDWLPQTVEIRSSPNGVGWRSGEVDSDGNFVEPAADRLTKIDEWSFVSPDQFAGPITPAVIAKGADAERLLEESTDSMHSYLTYRQIDRPGPHPADFINRGDGKMFAPMTEQERATALHPKTPGQLLVPSDGDQMPADPRQVAYWVTLFLPTRWTPPPVDAKHNELYIYRPDFYQDSDGIERRVALWLDPSLRSTEAFHLQDVFSHQHAAPSAATTTNGPGATPDEGDALDHPFDQALPVPASTKQSPKPAPANTNTVPSGRANP